jgi:transposase InsO family protein
MTPDISSVQNPRPDHTPVRLADHSVVEATHLGTMSLPIDGDTPIKSLVVQSLHKPLISIANLCNADLTVVFTKSSCNIYSTSGFKPHGELAGRGYRRGNLYYLPAEPVSSESVSSSIVSVFDNTLLGYHHCFSHIGLRALKTLLREHKITPSNMNEIAVQQCPTCVQSKMHRTAFKSRSAYRSNAPGQLIHLDVGSYEVKSREGYSYFVTFIDDHSKFVSVFPMKSKSDVFSCFKNFRTFFEKSGKHTIMALRTDNRGEYTSKEFESCLTTSGIRHKPGPPHSPQLNGVAE